MLQPIGFLLVRKMPSSPHYPQQHRHYKRYPDIVVHGQLRRFDEGARKGGQRGGPHRNMSDLKMFGNMPGTDCARNVRVPDIFFRTMCNVLSLQTDLLLHALPVA